MSDWCPVLTGNNIISRLVICASYWHVAVVLAYKKSRNVTWDIHKRLLIINASEGIGAYCLRSSTSLAVRPAISPMERRMSSLSLGSSQRLAMRLASASSALMFSSPSGLAWGSASQAYNTYKYCLVHLEHCTAFLDIKQIGRHRINIKRMQSVFHMAEG